MIFFFKDMVIGKFKVIYEGYEVIVFFVIFVDIFGNFCKIIFNIFDKFLRKVKLKKLLCKFVCGY